MGRRRTEALEEAALRLTSDELAGAAVLAWLTVNDIPPALVGRARTCRQLVEVAGGEEACTSLLPSNAVSSLKDVERAFELSLGEAHRRLEGAVYTPDYVIDYLITQADLLRGGERPPTILDPACGSGGFLVRAVKHIMSTYDMSLHEALGRVAGVDKDRKAITRTAALLELLCLAAGEPPPPEFKLHVGDSLLTRPRDLVRQLDQVGGFDVVATNPPYVKLQNLTPDYRILLGQRFGDLAKGSFSLALLFLVQCRELLSTDGVASLITQNNLFTSLAGKAVRQELQRHGALRRVVDFGHARVFQDASAYTCLVLLGRQPQDKFELGYPEGEPSMRALQAMELHQLSTPHLDSRKWRLAPPVDLGNLTKLESRGTPLGQLCAIRVGFATLKDRVFFVEADGTSRLPDGRVVTVELEATRQAVKVANLKSETELPELRRPIIFPYAMEASGLQPYAEAELRDRFPQTHRYLSAWRDVLAGRDKGKTSRAQWFEWGRRQALEAPGPKLLTKTFNSRPQFFYDPTDHLFCNGYSVQIKTSAKLPYGLDVLQLLLESDVMDYYAHLTSFQISGGYQCYQKNFIERFCLPDLTAGDAVTLRQAGRDERQEMLAQLFEVDRRAIAHALGRDT